MLCGESNHVADMASGVKIAHYKGPFAGSRDCDGAAVLAPGQTFDWNEIDRNGVDAPRDLGG
jgi:hypothetical protein